LRLHPEHPALVRHRVCSKNLKPIFNIPPYDPLPPPEHEAEKQRLQKLFYFEDNPIHQVALPEEDPNWNDWIDAGLPNCWYDSPEYSGLYAEKSHIYKEDNIVPPEVAHVRLLSRQFRSAKSIYYQSIKGQSILKPSNALVKPLRTDNSLARPPAQNLCAIKESNRGAFNTKEANHQVERYLNLSCHRQISNIK